MNEEQDPIFHSVLFEAFRNLLTGSEDQWGAHASRDHKSVNPLLAEARNAVPALPTSAKAKGVEAVACCLPNLSP
jgi:hypothetical protein